MTRSDRRGLEWQPLLRQIGIPSWCFAGVVFVSGWFPVSPFAHWPFWAIAVLALPAVTPFVGFVIASGRRPARRGRNAEPWEQPLPPRPFRWGEVVSGRRAFALGALAAAIFVSFLMHLTAYDGGPDIVDGRYALTDHGEFVRFVTRDEWLERRTDDTRLWAGHLLLFGAVGLLASPASTPSRVMGKAPRPRSDGNRNDDRGRPGGRRRRSAR